MKKSFSIIVPVYNVEKYLDRCMSSILKQTNHDFEVILIDDGSKDSSGSICDIYAEKYENVRAIHQHNQGLSAARNTGIDNAEGNYLCFVDSDDMISESFLQDVADVLHIQKNADLIEFNYCREMTPDVYELNGTRNYKVLDKKSYIEELVKIKIGNQIWFRIYKASLFNDVRFPVGRNYEDIPVFYRLALKSNKIIRIDYTYYIYNITNLESITKKTDFKTMMDLYKSTNEFYEGIKTYCLENSIDIDYLEYNVLSKYIHIFYKLYRSKQTDNDLFRELKNNIKKHKRVNLSKYKGFEWKKMLVVMALLKLRIL